MTHLPENNALKGLILMIGAAFCFSVMGALAKLSGGTLPFCEIVFFRALVNLVTVAPIIYYRKISFFGRNRPVLLVRSLAGFSALSLSFYVIVKLPLADASILNQLSVPFIALISVFAAKGNKHGAVLLYALLAFLGAFCIIKPGLAVFNSAGLLGVLGALCSAVAVLQIRQLHTTEHSLTIVFNFCFYSTLLSLILFGTEFFWPQGAQWFWLIAMGLAGSLGQILMTRSYAYGTAAQISPFTYIGVVFSAVWGALFWNEIPDSLSLLGGALVIFSSFRIVRAGF